jgi:hypothetical protein
MSNTRIYAADKSFDIGCRVIKWDEEDGIDFHPYSKYVKRDISHEELQRVLRQFTIHWSVTYRAIHMRGGLIARGLSCNFMIDDDPNPSGYATIYQCLDLKHGGWSQGAGCNGLGPGVEISYMPQAWSDQHAYSERRRNRYGVGEHEQAMAPIHGRKMRVFLPTPAQMNSLYQLIWGYSELFPDIPMTFPRGDAGEPLTKVLKAPKEYSGLLQHYHIKRSKIDAAGLDMKRIEEEVAQRKKVGY